MNGNEIVFFNQSDFEVTSRWQSVGLTGSELRWRFQWFDWMVRKRSVSNQTNARSDLQARFFFLCVLCFFNWADILRIKTYALNTTGPLELLAFAWMEIEKDFLDQERTWSN